MKHVFYILRVTMISLFLLVSTLPILWVLITSFKSESATRDRQLRFIPASTDGSVYISIKTFEGKTIEGQILDEGDSQIIVNSIKYGELQVDRSSIQEQDRVEKRALISLKNEEEIYGFIIDKNNDFLTVLDLDNKKVMVPLSDINDNGIHESLLENLKFRAGVDESYALLKEADGDQSFLGYLLNSFIIASISTICAVLFGTSTAYGFSRFKLRGSKGWLFFILSTRFLPPLAIVVPVLILYQELSLDNSHLGMIILYTAFNLSLAVWLMKGFIDDIPVAYEEAAMVDGYSRIQTFFKIILPQSAHGMTITAVFCLIAAWNEYSFAMILNGKENWTAPVYFGLQKNLIEGTPWPMIAAGIIVFLLPVILFVIMIRKHLLRGMTFGTIKG